LSSVTIAPAPAELTDKRRRSFVLVFLCTLVGAAAQMLIKTGASTVTRPGFFGAVVAMLTNGPLFAGYCLYGLNTILMVLALKDGELSVVYPVIALTYVWVTLLSMMIFHEPMNLLKGIGIGVIVAGVAVLGRSKAA
jgi:multidrug transporter EmrE-like cation transporter